MKRDKQASAQVHRFGEYVAVWVGTGGTTYFTEREARMLAREIAKCARSIRDQPDFAKSSYKTFGLNTGD
jgi:hypothetical protein